jgi:hypothetical protein
MTRKVHNSYAAFRDRTAAWPRVGDENLALGDPPPLSPEAWPPAH